MKTYFAYIRVSTAKQGQAGSSLQEQKSAIEAYARRHGLPITKWFEEKETASKLGRPIFAGMLQALEQGLASGVITHKIDRSARNLRDWATLGELFDRGVELHFAYESIDLSSRGGRLSADIQAVVAADYVRNLRSEVLKGFYGRLKQGLYPLPAPLGYLDHGGGQPKSIDPQRGPLVAKAFELYGTDCWSLEGLSHEMFKRGLRRIRGGKVTRNGLSSTFNNPFYIGLIRIQTTREYFKGVHPPLIDKNLFDRVQAVLEGRAPHKSREHRYRYQRLIQCATCGRSLTATRQKGHIYYRCHTRACPTTCIREERIDDALKSATSVLRLRKREWEAVWLDIEKVLAQTKTAQAHQLQSVSLAIAAIDERLGRHADAYVDNMLDKSTYLMRKQQLLEERADLVSKKAKLGEGSDGHRKQAQEMFELVKTLGNLADLPSHDHLRSILKDATSNLSVQTKNVVITWRNPFQAIFFDPLVTYGGPNRTIVRTGVKLIRSTLSRYLGSLMHPPPKPILAVSDPELPTPISPPKPPLPKRKSRKIYTGGTQNIIDFNERRQRAKEVKRHEDDAWPRAA